MRARLLLVAVLCLALLAPAPALAEPAPAEPVAEASALIRAKIVGATSPEADNRPAEAATERHPPSTTA